MPKTRYTTRPRTRPRLQKLQREYRKQQGVYKSTYLAKVDGAVRLPGGLFWVHDANGTDANGNTIFGAPRKMPMLPGAAILPRPNTKVDVVTINGIDYIARSNSTELARMGVDAHQTNSLDPGAQYKVLEWLTNLQGYKTPGASSTHIVGSVYKKPDGTYDVFPTTGGYDFVTANVPAADMQVVVCQWLDTDTNTITATVSSEVSRDTDLKHIDNVATTVSLINECVAAAPTSHIGVNAWRVYDDTTIGTLSDNNKLADLRGIVGSAVAGGVSDAADVTYTPTTLTDWTSDADPGDAADALDQLADRVTDLEAIPGGTDANAIHVNVADELSGLPEETSLDPADRFMIEKGDDSGKAYILAENLPGISGAMRRIDRQVLGSAAATVTLSAIPGTYSTLVLQMTLRGDTTGTFLSVVSVRFNGDTGSNYDWERLASSAAGAVRTGGAGVTSGNLGTMPAPGSGGSTTPAGQSGMIRVEIPDYANTVFRKQYKSSGGYRNTPDATGGFVNEQVAGNWRNSAAITQIDVLSASGNFAEGSIFTLWGIE